MKTKEFEAIENHIDSPIVPDNCKVRCRDTVSAIRTLTRMTAIKNRQLLSTLPGFDSPEIMALVEQFALSEFTDAYHNVTL